MEYPAKRYIIILTTFSLTFTKNYERVSCVDGVEREGLMMRVKDRSCGFAFICHEAEHPKVDI